MVNELQVLPKHRLTCGWTVRFNSAYVDTLEGFCRFKCCSHSASIVNTAHGTEINSCLQIARREISLKGNNIILESKMPVWTKKQLPTAEELFCECAIWGAKSLKTVFSFCFFLFLLSGTKAAYEQTVQGFPKLSGGEPRQRWKAIVPFFSILLLHTSKSPDNLLIIPRHLDKSERKLSLFYSGSTETDFYLKKKKKGKKTELHQLWSQVRGSNGRADTCVRIPTDWLNLPIMLTVAPQQ